MVLSTESRLVKVKQAMKNFLDRVEDIEGHLYRLETSSREYRENPKEELRGELQGTLNVMTSDLAHKNKSFIALVEAMRSEIIELKGDLMRP